MRVHLRNVIADAVERGVTLGVYRANRHATVPYPEPDIERLVNTVIDTVWDSLDTIVDFDDDDEEESSSQTIGFGETPHDVADAVSDQTVVADPDYKDTDEDRATRLLTRRRDRHRARRRTP